MHFPQTDSTCIDSFVFGVQIILTFDAFAILDAGQALESSCC
jgi:hypothetical protein